MITLLLIVALADEITYKKDMQPLFDKKCSACHNPNMLSNMNWLDEKQARANANKILVRTTVSKDMPMGGKLTEQEITLIKAWVAGGAK